MLRYTCYTHGVDLHGPIVNSIGWLEIKLKITFASILRLVLQGHLTHHVCHLSSVAFMAGYMWLLLPGLWLGPLGTLEGSLKNWGTGSGGKHYLEVLLESTHPTSSPPHPAQLTQALGTRMWTLTSQCRRTSFRWVEEQKEELCCPLQEAREIRT